MTKRNATRINNKRILFIAIAALILIACGLIACFSHVNIADKEANAATYTVNVDVIAKSKGVPVPATGIVAGQTIDFTIDISCSAKDQVWFASALYFSPVKLNGASYDLDKDVWPYCELLSYADGETNSIGWNADGTNFKNYAGPEEVLTDTGTLDTVLTGTMATLGIPLSFAKKTNGSQTTAVNAKFFLRIKILETLPESVTSIQFGFKTVTTNKVSINSSKELVSTASSPSSFQSLTVLIKKPSTDCTLSELKAGHDPAGNGIALTSVTVADNMTYTSNNADLSNFTIRPTANHSGADIKVGFNNPPSDPVASGALKKMPLTATVSDIKIYILVTAESGATKTYTLTVKIAYARLFGITLAVDPVVAGASFGFTFDRDVEIYNVNIPDGTDTVTIKATVLPGYASNDMIGVGRSSCLVDTNSFSSSASGSVEVSNLQNTGSSVTLTVTAQDGTTRKNYKLNFTMVSKTATLNGVPKVISSISSGTTYPNDPTSAATDGVDFYYTITEPSGSGGVKISSLTPTDSNAKVYINDVLYDPNTVYAEGDYIIKVVAPAGNNQQYKLKLSSPKVVELSLSSSYRFLKEEIIDDMFYLRLTYDKLGWTHGVDDVGQVDRYVLGQIKPMTTINELLSNISTTQHGMIRIITHEDLVVWDMGVAGADISDPSELDDSLSFAVGTGWRLEFGPTKGTPVETVYLSVLGDLDGDGFLTSVDIATYYAHIAFMNGNTARGEELPREARLAALITNGGSYDALEIATHYQLQKGFEDPEDYFYPTLDVDPSDFV